MRSLFTSSCVVFFLALFISQTVLADETNPRPVAGGSNKIPYSQLTPSEREIIDNGEVSPAQYAVGGIVGTFLGLGIGQAIQGRYLPTGLIMTIGEAGAIGMLEAGAVSCVADDFSNALVNNNTNTTTCHNGLFTAGAILYIGLRIWEIVDVWATPPSINSRYQNLKDHVEMTSTHFYVSPVSGLNSVGLTGAQLAVQFRF